MNGTWKKTLTRFIHKFEGFAKMRSLQKINKTGVEMANNSNLGMDENDVEKFLEMVSEELIDELLKLKVECIAEEEAREEET